MKKTLLLTLILALGFSTRAQQLDWVHTPYSVRTDDFRSIIRDKDGNYYLFGNTFGGININVLHGGDTVKRHHAFLAKYDSSFNLLWLRSFGGSGTNSDNEASAWKAIIMPDGNILLGGMFRGTVNFNPHPGALFQETSKDPVGDIFLSKVDTSGKLIKNVVFQGDWWDDMYQWKLIVDSDSRIYVLANFTNNVDLDPGPGQQIQTTGGKDMFFVCLDDNLDYQWHIRFNNQYSTWWNPIIKPDKTIMLSGHYNTPMDVDPDTGIQLVHAANGIRDKLLIEYSPTGKYIKHYDPLPQIVTSSFSRMSFNDNRFFIPCTVHDSADFNPGKPGGKIKTMEEISCLLMTDTGFNFLGIYNTQAGTVSLGEVKKVGSYYYIPGSVRGALTDFDPSPDTFLLPKTYSGIQEGVLIRLDTQLNFSWAGSTNSYSEDMYVNSWLFEESNIYFCGEMGEGGHDFDLTSGTNSRKGLGVFLAKYNLCSPSYHIANDEDLCEGRTRRFGRLDITSAGNYTQAFLSNQVCDSVVNLNVNLKPRSYHSFAQAACEGEEFAFAGILPWNTGLYYDTLQSFNGCDSIIELQFTRKSIDSTVTANAGVLLANATGHNYRWLDCNNQMQPIFGETNREFTPSKNGQYAVEVSANNCADTSHCIEVSGVGMAEHALGMYKVYPNPAGDNVFIETKGENLYIILNDITGKPVMTEITGSQTFSLDISDLAPGTYYLEIEGPEAKERVKIIKR